MGSFDGAELPELLDLYILHISGEKYGEHRIGLYRDDGWACFRYTSGPQADGKNKFYKDFGGRFWSCKTNLKGVNVQLTTGKYQPYNERDNNPLYINILFNHPPNIIKNLPGNISKRINTLSADEKTTFNKS